MNKKLAIPTTILAFLSIALMVMHHPFQAKAGYEPLHVHGQLSDSAKDIFAKVHQQISTLKEANTFAQANFIRKGERWQKQQETPVHEEIQKNRSAIIDDLQRLTMIDEIKPAKKHYTYAGLMGALAERVVYRMNYLQELIDAGYTFDYVVLLGGERPLQELEKVNLPESVKTETDMMVHFFKNSPLKDSKMILVNAPMVQKADGTLVRPNTDDTLVYFQQTAPEDGSFLVISNNPYIARQTKVAQRILDQKRFPVDGAGKKADAEELDIIMVMDEFARLVYEEFKAYSAQAA